MLKRRRLLFHFGNLLILISILGFTFVYYPYLSLFWNAPEFSVIAADDPGFYLSIPKLEVSSPVIANVDPWNKSAYSAALNHGVAQARGTGLPGEGKGIFLFAHSSEAPWRMTRQNTAFLRLSQLNPGDQVKVHYHGQDYEYEVLVLKTVWPSEVSVLTEALNSDQLVLQTCTPIGTSLKRLLVIARPINHKARL